jgi:hypothetical protein
VTDKPDRVTVTLPLPSPNLHAHAKGHWRGKAAATKSARELAAATVWDLRKFRWPVARLSMRFFWPDKRRRDTLNAAHSCKPYVDGLVDAGLVLDDCWTALEIGGLTSEVDKTNPRVEITVERLS